MARRTSKGLSEIGFLADLSALTDDGDVDLGRLVRDGVEIVAFSVEHISAGVGTQNVTYALKAGSTTISGRTGNVANATAGASGAGVGLGPVSAMTEGAILKINADFAAAVTSGSAKVSVRVLYRA